MRAQLQRQSAPHEDLLDSLHESYANIRRFLSLGRRLAKSPPVDEAEVCALAGIIQRYSAVGLRLVIADEEALVPYLAGRNANLDGAIAKMRADHAEYDEHVRGLVALCRTIDGEQLGGRGAELAEAINAMAAHLEPHLALMERDILPALAELAPDELDQIHAAMEARRDRATRADW